MSIVALKNKARAMWDPHSRGKDGFSLNGKSRFTSGVGVNLAKSVTRTPFRGTEPMGHGGGPRCRVAGIEARVNHCNGPQYPRFVANSGACSTLQYLVKPSVMNTSGMIQTRFMGILHGTYPKTWVQRPQDSSSTYDERLAAKSAACSTSVSSNSTVEERLACEKNAAAKPNADKCVAYAKNIGIYSKSVASYTKTIGPETTTAHLLRMTSPALNPTCDKAPFPIPFSASSGCKSFYATWQEAQKAGLLCAGFNG